MKKRSVKVYIEPRDWWVGYYRSDTHHYVCPLPCVVIRWRRRDPFDRWLRRQGVRLMPWQLAAYREAINR